MAGDDDGPIRVDVLGPIRAATVDGRDLTPEGLLQRRLFALLVLRRGHVVSVDSAIDVLWPRQPPRDPVAALHNHVFRLRRGLPDGVIESTGDGYRLVPARIDLDADRLAGVLNAGVDGDPTTVAVIDAAFDRWQGPAYPELDDVDDGRIEATRLDELRVRAVEARAAARLATGDTDRVVADLVGLVDVEPLRERPRALLMEALAQSGRVSEALRVYDDFRRELGRELGIEPSPALTARHAELLTGTGTGLWTPTTRLPVAATSLIGRDELVADVLGMVGDHRLVTLVGPGGVGKTRLVIDVGQRLAATDADRPVVLCELATAVEESAVDVVAAALGIDVRPGVPLVDRVADVLGSTAVVVVLDNCEHVLDPIAELVQRILATCPNVAILATSRERLRVPGEQVRPVPVLSADGRDAPAVDLFLERARAVDPAFVPDADEVALISDVVSRLDGLPLAIELAAARLHTHDVNEVAAGLDQRFALLSTGYRSSSRHGSLSATVSWSFGLLDPVLQRTFTDVSVFSGSFSAADAAAICDGDVAAVTAALHQLVERSLVMRAPGRRYVLLETLRSFGLEQLAQTGRHDEVGARHAHHQVEWIEQANGQLLGSSSTVIAQIDAAVPELRAAVGWLLDHGEVDAAGRLIAALLGYGFLRLRPDVIGWSQRVIAADPGDEGTHAPFVWVAAAYTAWMAGDVAAISACSQRALNLMTAAGGEGIAWVLTICGSDALFDGRLDAAADWYRRARTAAADVPGESVFASGNEVLALAFAGQPRARELAAELLAEVGEARTGYSAYAWFCAGEAAQTTDVERARRCFTRAVELAELTGASFVAELAGASKASIDARLGDPRQAAETYRTLMSRWRAAGMWSTQWTMLRSIAGLLARLDRPRDAAVLAAAVRSTQAGHRIFGADEAALDELDRRLRTALGADAFESAQREGAELDGDAAVELALRALATS